MSNVNPIVYVIDAFKTIQRKAKRNILPKDTGYFASNLRYDTEYGAIAKRLSRALFNPTSLGTSAIPALYRYYKNSTGSAAMIGAYSGTLKIAYDDLGIFSNIKTGLTSNNWTFLTYKDLLYMVNGEDSNLVFGLTSKTSPVENMGVPSSATLPSATISATAGNLGNGNYFYGVAFQFDSYQEGSISPSSVGVNPNGSRITLTIPTSANSRATGRYLYRTKSAASILYRLATVSDNTSLTYADNIADTALDTTIQASIDYDPSASYKFMTLHKERVFLARNKTNKSDIVYSDIRNGTSYPDVFPVNNRLRIAQDDGDEITAQLNDHFGQLIVFKQNSIRIINTQADSPSAWSISDNLSNQGCIASYSAVSLPMGIIYLTRYGEQKKRLMMWTGSGVQLLPQLEGIEDILTAIPNSTLEDVRGHYQNGYYYLAYRDVAAGDLFNNRLLVIDVFTWGISIDKKNIASFAAWSGSNDIGELYTGASDSGKAYREDTALFDLLIRYKSDFDAGTFSQTQSLGVEATPSLGLTTAVANNIGARTWASFSGINDTWGSLSGYNDTWWLGGQWLDKVRDISAKALNTLYWNENKPTDTDVLFYLRLGDSVVACQSAAWNGPYTNTSAALSSLTAAKYIQFLVKLFTKNYADYDKVNVYRSGITDDSYAIKVSANFGNPDEATIEFDWQSGRIDLGDINEAYKRLRKRLRSVKVEYEPASGSTGNLDFQYYLNGSSTQAGSFNASFADFPRTKIYNFPLGMYCDDFIYRLYSNSDNKSLKIKKVIFTVSVEKLTVLK